MASNPGRVANLYFPVEQIELDEEVRRLAEVNGVSVSEMYIRLIDAGLAELRRQYPEAFRQKHSGETDEAEKIGMEE